MVAFGLMPERSFDGVTERIVRYLAATTPMRQWAVTRFANGQEYILTASAVDTYGVARGDEFPLEMAMCDVIARGNGPRIAPSSRAVPAFEAAVAYADDSGVVINSFVSTPIVRADGEIFGTICGLDPEVKDDGLYLLEPLLDLLSSMLSAVLVADQSATQTERELEQARQDADTDALTGLLNRRGWDRFIEHEEARFRRFGDPASVVMIDLDRLKEINDRLGHDAGDEHLRRAAAVMRRTTRESDVVARLGGDEFGIIAVGAGPAQCVELVRRVEQGMEDEGVAGSIGHATFTVVAGFPGAQAEADRKMYEAKRRRREEFAAGRAATFAGSPADRS
jgi:diguanylate cyclase